MKKRYKSLRGVITVFVSLMLISVLSLGTLVIESARYQAGKTQLSEATISAGTSMIASYDAELYDRYGLLAIDTENFTEARCREYLDFNADLSPSFFGNRVSRLYSVSSTELQGMYNLTYPSVLKRQILSRAKYHVIPQDYALNLYNVDSFLSDLQTKCIYVADALENVANGTATPGSSSDVNADMLSALDSLYSTFKDDKKYDDTCNIILPYNTVALLPTTTGTIESSVPDEDRTAIQNTLAKATTILGGEASCLASSGEAFTQTDVSINAALVADMTNNIKNVSSLSDVTATAKTYASNCRQIALAINAAVNMLASDKEGNLLLNSYIAEYFSNRNNNVESYTGPGKASDFSGEDSNFAAACVEYIFGGDGSEFVNQESAYNYILSIRLVYNLYNALNNSTTFQSANAYSTLCHIAWGYYETCVDMKLLTDYNADVPLNKYSMILNVNNCGAAASAFASNNFVTAMSALGIYNGTEFRVTGVDNCSYRDCLSVALWLVPNSEKLLRAADLIQLEMRYREHYVENKIPSFLMSEQNTFCRVKCNARLNSLLPVITLGSNSGINGISFSSVKYLGY